MNQRINEARDSKATTFAIAKFEEGSNREKSNIAIAILEKLLNL